MWRPSIGKHGPAVLARAATYARGDGLAGQTDDDAAAILTVDLGAIVANYRMLAARAAPAICAAVVKADAYGLGVAEVAPALARAGCEHFFVAHAAEGVALRRVLGAGAAIHVLHGPLPGTEPIFTREALVPVLNSAAQAAGWQAGGGGMATLQVDTGMARLGVPAQELAGLPALDLCSVMSHLACADDPAHPANAAQRAAFAALRARWPGVPASLAASSGIFLGPAYHFDMVRPGASLYGGAPQAGANPMRPVVRLQARVIQVRDIPQGAAVGYGESWRAGVPSRIATIACGYADGYRRSASNHGAAWLDGVRLPVVGRVSMDSITLDATALPPGRLSPGTLVELIGPHWTIDDVAATAGTIGYEVLTSLGQRFRRRYAPYFAQSSTTLPLLPDSIVSNPA